METQEYVSPSVELEPDEEKSAFDRFAEVFTSPAEAFAGLGSAKRGPIILWGLIITVVVSLFSIVLFSTNETLRQTATDKQTEQLEKMRDSGKISEEQYDKQVEQMEMMSSGGVFLAIGAITGAVGTVLFALFAGLIVFILMRVLQRKGEPALNYSTALAAALIGFMIMNVESIITALAMFFTSNPEFRISPAMFGTPDNSFLTFAINLVNPFTIWLWIAMGTGIAVITRAERGKSIGMVAGAWIGVGLLLTGIGALFGSIFG